MYLYLLWVYLMAFPHSHRMGRFPQRPRNFLETKRSKLGIRSTRYTEPRCFQLVMGHTPK